MTHANNKKLFCSIYKRAYLIRATEEKLGQTSSLLYGPVHLMLGQELVMATLASFFSHCEYGDVIYGSHRSHGCLLALEESPLTLFAEIMGKQTGCSQGMGGSMHINSPSNGFLGSNPIIAGVVPMAVGSALKLKPGRGVAIAFFGDGACEEGILHESLNLAATWEVPAVFLCINNHKASHMRIDERQTSSNMSRFASPHGIKHYTAFGADVDHMIYVYRHAIQYARDTRCPVFIEVNVTKISDHVGQGVDNKYGYYEHGEFKAGGCIDPCMVLKDTLLTRGFATEEEIATMKKTIKDLVEETWQQAAKDPFPTKKQLYQFLAKDQE